MRHCYVLRERDDGASDVERMIERLMMRDERMPASDGDDEERMRCRIAR